jgi:hypothetical protein
VQHVMLLGRSGIHGQAEPLAPGSRICVRQAKLARSSR